MKTKILSAYKLLLAGYSSSFLAQKGFSELEIEKAVKFRDNYQNRDVLSSSIAKEMQISYYAVKRMQKSYNIYSRGLK